MASMTDWVIETEGVSRRFGAIQAVDRLDLRVPRGAVVGFLGPNGAGKTTTIRMLLGLIRAQGGAIRLGGHDIHRDRRKALTGVGSLVETPAHYPHLTGAENLDIACHMAGLPKSERDRVLDLVGLAGAARRKSKGYSLGMRQRLGLARALLGRPKLLILDEPTNGLDPSGIHEMRTLIREAPERFGATVLVSSHLLGEVEQTADHVALMHRGKLLFQDPLEALMDAHPGGLTIRLDRPDEAAARVAANHANVAQTADGIHLPGRFTPAERAAINRDLVEAGFAVSELAAVKPSLESIFLERTGGTGELR